MLKKVRVKENQRFVECPFCGEKLDLEENVGCKHVDEDYITFAANGEYDVWFRQED